MASCTSHGEYLRAEMRRSLPTMAIPFRPNIVVVSSSCTLVHPHRAYINFTSLNVLATLRLCPLCTRVSRL